MAARLLLIPTAELHPDPANPRDDATPDDELVASVAELGVLQALLVRTDPEGGYLITAGHRRWGAAVASRTAKVPARVVDDWSPEQTAAAQVAENMHRVALNPVEEAKAVDRMLKMTGASQMSVARLLGISQAKVSRYVQILRLPRVVREKLARGDISIMGALGYDQAPSQRLASGAPIHPAYDALREAIKMLGRAILKGDPDGAGEAADEAAELLGEWTSGSGRSAGGESPKVRCPYCREQVPVGGQATTEERRRAHARHRMANPRCQSEYSREQRAAARG